MFPSWHVRLNEQWLVVCPYRQCSQAVKSINVLCQEDWVAFHPYLVHACADVAGVVRFAECVIGDRSDVVVLQNKTNLCKYTQRHRHTLLYATLLQMLTCFLASVLFLVPCCFIVMKIDLSVP